MGGDMSKKWAPLLKKVFIGTYLGAIVSILTGLILAFTSLPASAGSIEWKTATEPHNTKPGEAVIPTLKCALHNSDGTFTALFGYDNRNSERVTIEVGDKNKFSPKPEDRGQTVQFAPGSKDVAFEVIYHEDDRLTWSLTGPDGKTHTVTASDGTKRCEKPEEKPTATPTHEREKDTATPTNTAEPRDTQVPTERPTATEQPVSDTATPNPTSPPEPTVRNSAAPTPTAIPPTQTVVTTSLPPLPSSTPTQTSVPVDTSTPLPTLPPPAPAASITPGLIPVTGADRLPNDPSGQAGPLGWIETGILLLGLGAVLHGAWLRISGR
jgi:hypothetical protein